jgi:hypothetical protein
VNHPCAEPIYPCPERDKVQARTVWNARTAMLERLYQPRSGHVNWPPGYRERLATRGALAPEPEDD